MAALGEITVKVHIVPVIADYNELARYVGLWATCARCGELVPADDVTIDDELMLLQTYGGEPTLMPIGKVVVCTECHELAPSAV